MSDVLAVDGLEVGYGGAPVVRGLGLRVGPGEVLALLGPNGAGKTTTLRAIAGTLRPLAGSIAIAGADVAGASATTRARRGLGYVPEGRGVFSGLTVAEHFRIGPRRERLDLEQACAWFPALDELRGRRAGLLSGGEQQMLVLARALARAPTLLLIDELSLGLAPIVVERMLPVVRRFASETGTGVLLVEQHVHLALEIADRGAVMSHGELVLERPASELRDNHDLLIASYLGGQALPPATVQQPIT